MIVIKNINNNVSLCLDSKHREVIAMGKGIGFIKPPYEVPLAKIERTFYKVTKYQIDLLSSIDPEILEVSARITEYAELKLKKKYPANMVFTLADHISFSIQRIGEQITISLPVYYQVRQEYPEEVKTGEYALKLIQKYTGHQVPKTEACAIALHLINNGNYEPVASVEKKVDIIEESTKIIENEVGEQIDRHTFNYNRFATHMQYLLQRTNQQKQISSENRDLFEQAKEKYKKSNDCALKIAQLIERKKGIRLSDEEILYLILHINRLCVREDLLPQ